MIILIHSSKTMRPPEKQPLVALREPQLIEYSRQLQADLQSLPVNEIKSVMKVSATLAEKTYSLIQDWTDIPRCQRAAIDSFLGDIYSGLQVQGWSNADRDYANQHLRILSGLYGIVRPLDGVYPYRLEMGYKLPETKYANLYKFWGDAIAKTIPQDEIIINLSAVEYSKVVTDYVDVSRVISPVFLTISPKTGEPAFVVVHSKIGRGAYANWMIKHRIDNVSLLRNFADLGYVYDSKLSTAQQPTFVCQNFGGLGLSVRLT